MLDNWHETKKTILNDTLVGGYLITTMKLVELDERANLNFL